MGPRLLPLLLLACLAAACATGAVAQREATPAVDQVSVIQDRSEQGAKTRLNETVTRRVYLVDGKSLPEIRANLLSEGGSDGLDARRYDGITSWSLRWTFRYERGPSSCSLSNATIDLSIEVRVPELAHPDALEPGLLARWRAYAGALEVHEMGHAGRETAVVEALAEAFAQAPAGADCGELGRRLDAIGADYMAQIGITDAAYDQETNHGVTEGAAFP